MRAKGKVYLMHCKIIYYQHYAHFVFFNIWVFDIFFYSTRDILHLKAFVDTKGMANLAFAYICSVLCIKDLLNLFVNAEELKKEVLPFN